MTRDLAIPESVTRAISDGVEKAEYDLRELAAEICVYDRGTIIVGVFSKDYG
jgi:hypothetical protein